METTGLIERTERIVATRAAVAAGDAIVADLEQGLADLRDVQAYLDASEAAFVSALKPVVPFPESAIAHTSRGTLGGASRTIERADTLDDTPRLAEALGDASITSAHVDAVTRAGKGLDQRQREQLLDIADGLADVAAAATPDQFGKRLRTERRRLLADDGMARLEQQQRQTSMRTWVDDDGMWNVKGRFDPVLGVELASALDTAVETLFADQVPERCPTDPIEKQAFLRAHAFARLVEGTAAGARRSGRPEFVAVIDVDQPNGVGGPSVDWPIPVEMPTRVLTDLIGDDRSGVHAVVVRNGVVIHAPGALDLGRSSRLANRSQRRALHGLYRTCAIPGCQVAYAKTKLHHIIWWRHGGRTDLDNLLPLCAHHHAQVHRADWQLTLGPNRELTVRFPDGSIQTTGPPSRRDVA